MRVPIRRTTDLGSHLHMSTNDEKRLAAEAAAELVESGMTVGLGTGSTVAFLLPALAARKLNIRCVATSPRTDTAARELGLDVETFANVDHFDMTIDGADQIAPDGWLVKGGGAAHTREKIVAAAADRFVVIADSSKPVESIHSPIPVELLSFGLRATMRLISQVVLRDAPISPDGGVIADYEGPSATRPFWPAGFRPRPVSSSTAFSRPRWSRSSWLPTAAWSSVGTSNTLLPEFPEEG